MAFKILNYLTDQETKPKPVKESSPSESLTISCKDFRGELSSITGIQSKFLFIPKLVNGLSEVKSLPPTVVIVCGEECKTNCIHLDALFKPKSNQTS